MKNIKTAGILLAAGRSSRMGQLKALLPWNGKMLIHYQIEQMQQAGIDPMIVVLGFQAERLLHSIAGYEVKTVINENYNEGKSSSIRKGLMEIQEQVDGIFISAVDQPVPFEVLIKMKKDLASNKAAVIIPTNENKRGHPILFRGSLHKELLNIREQTKGLRGVIHAYQDQITYLEVNDSSILFNLNRPEDYLKKRQEASNESIRN
ncbi:NTP transferase domain-containing protein [Siminovitchia sediminis]|uniref:NTP transferase domain-containing protein n=1 Tax=Siminovitchia sediminis TaxID=1274353 RepID=A0ABW4KD75_9BACI